MSLILKQRGESIGIWNLEERRWHKEPWTNRVSVARIRLSRERERLEDKEKEEGSAKPLNPLDLAGVVILVLGLTGLLGQLG
jgi:hypothetical protein